MKTMKKCLKCTGKIYYISDQNRFTVSCCYCFLAVVLYLFLHKWWLELELVMEDYVVIRPPDFHQTYVNRFQNMPYCTSCEEGVTLHETRRQWQ